MTQTHTVPEEVRHARADKALAMAFPEHSRVAFQRSFEAGLVFKGGKPLAQKANVFAGDVIEFSFPEVVSSELRPVKIKLDVLFEDKALLAVNKPAGMVVHPGAGTREDTLVHALLAHCKGSLSGIGGVERPGIVHRLDRETSGVIIVAKTDAAHRALASQFAARTVIKEYSALVLGVPRLMSGSIKKAIGRNTRHRHKMAVVEEAAGGRASWTDWVLLEKFGTYAALVLCTLHTGRTHQIRVHLSAIGHPLLGDTAYGWKLDSRVKCVPERVMLHSGRLSLLHPTTGKTLDLKAPLPADFKAQIKALRKG
ncbi:MAG TPA: RluA family pseudouridine synthase [Opitutaceae bacterium]|jgi:23S rRNA pseudouridine1911/1915/1917 synthase|nr:RluA family pseudouridine synthase [Opitutaceae bacterium]